MREQTPSEHGQHLERPRVRDRRVPPSGVLPRRLQTWLMAGMATVILGIILVTGRPNPPAPGGPAGQSLEPTLPPAERIRSFEQQLGDEERRRRAQAVTASAAAPRAAVAGPAGGAAVDQMGERDATLFADNVAFTRRDASTRPSSQATGLSSQGSTDTMSPPTIEELAAFQRLMSALAPGPLPPPAMPGTPALQSSAPAEQAPGPTRPAGLPTATGRYQVPEGTAVETVLLNRLDGTFEGPVSCQVTTPVYSLDRQHILIPAGARLLGAASPVQAWGESRLAVHFHRLLMPDGRTYSLDRFIGLTQVGETGLKDRVDRHYLQVFGASLAIGAVSGLSLYGTRVGFDQGVGDAARQSAGASLATSTGRVLDRYLNVLPTLTIREGYRIAVYFTNDVDLPAYAPAAGGVQ